MTSFSRFAAASALTFVLLVSGAQAEEGPPPLSASPSSLTLTGGKGEVAISNESAVPLALTARVTDKNGNAVPGATVVPPSGGTLAAGATVMVSVNAPNPPPASTLVIVAAPAAGLPRGAVLRISLSAREAAKAAVTEWTFVNVHPGTNSGTQLPLTAACGGLELAKPSKPTELGTVQTEGEQLTVTGTCSNVNAKAIELSISAPKTDGRVYKGKIKVGGGEVELTVEDKLCAGLAALFIFIGIAVALWVGSWQGGRRPAKELQRETRVVEAFVSPRNEKNVEKSFKDAAATLELPIEVQDWTIGAAVRSELAELRRGLRGSPSEEALKAAHEALAKLELELREWPKVANLLGELQLRGPRLEILPHYYQPILLRTTQRRGPLDLAAMRDIKAAADEAVTLANDWPSDEIKAAQTFADNLPKEVPVPASFDGALRRFNAATSVKSAEQALKAFWKANNDLHDAAGKGPVARGVVAVAGGGAGPSDLVFEPAETEDPAETASHLAEEILVTDIVVLVLLLGVALVAGMQLLWVGKSFGGFWDVLAALSWGLGAGAIGKPLSDAVINLGRSRINAEGA